jgi:uncharacterized membrane protein YphA (DoxX/SURF4 family)
LLFHDLVLYQQQITFSSDIHQSLGERIMASIRNYAPTAARVLLGVIFTVFGLNGFLNFLPQPPMPAGAGAFVGGLASSGYFFPLLKGTEVIMGLLLLSNRLVPLALTVLAPIVLNIVLFHAFLAPGGIGIAIVVLALELTLAWAYRDAYRGVLNPSARPRLAAVTVEQVRGIPAHQS